MLHGHPASAGIVGAGRDARITNRAFHGVECPELREFPARRRASILFVPPSNLSGAFLCQEKIESIIKCFKIMICDRKLSVEITVSDLISLTFPVQSGQYLMNIKQFV